MYRVKILDAAEDDLEHLDKAVGRRIAKRIQWLADNFDNIKPEALTGDLAEFYKLRVGDYRVFYQILSDEQLIVIHHIGHRREVYRKR